MVADWCIHIANIFYLMSFVGRDMLWLRILTCFGLAFGIVFFTQCQPTPMYGPTFWHITFLFINFYQIRHLILERQRLRPSHEEEVVGRAMLEGLSDEELADSLAHAIHSESKDVEILTKDDGHVLTDEEIVLRDIAFNRLSRGELLNLLSRRIWRSLKRVRPRRWWQGMRSVGRSQATGA